MGVAYNSSIITNGLKLCLDPMNNKSYSGTGTVLTDVSNNGLHANLSSSFSGVSLTSGRTATTSSTDILNTDLHSIFFTVRFNTTPTYGASGYSGSWDKILSFNAGGSDRTPSIWRWPGERSLHWRYDPNNSGCDFGKSAGGTGNQFDIDTWYYVGVTKNNSTTNMFVNGIQVGTSSVSYPKTAGNASIVIYEYYPADLISIGFIHIYNRPLTNEEVMHNWTSIRGRYNI